MDVCWLEYYVLPSSSDIVPTVTVTLHDCLLSGTLVLAGAETAEDKLEAMKLVQDRNDVITKKECHMTSCKINISQ